MGFSNARIECTVSSWSRRLRGESADEAHLGGGREEGEGVPFLSDAPLDSDTTTSSSTLADLLAIRVRRMRAQGPEWVSSRVASWRSLKLNMYGRRGESWTPTDVWRGDHGCYQVHVDGAWGTGKSSFLNMLMNRLRNDRSGLDEQGWVIVRFNAQEHQHIVPRWWSLLTILHRHAIRELWGIDRPRAITLWLWRVWWQIREGRAGYFLLPLAGILAFYLWNRGFFGKDLGGLGDSATALAAIATFLATVWAGARTVNRWLLTGTLAEAHLERTEPRRRLVTT
jgi:hypothetical protein